MFCSIGFYRFIWFMSVGYGLAIAGIGMAMLVLGIIHHMIDLSIAMLCILAIAYGCRLGGFLLIRDLKVTSYNTRKDVKVGKVPLFVQVIMWIFMFLLYYCETSPIWYRMNNIGHGDIFAWIGIIIALCGIVLEAIADSQKNDAKKKNPALPAMDGIYKLCRCPNYFGELVFWTGVFISGVNIIHGAQWIIALIGYIGIIVIMISGAKRLEKRHIKNYGKLPVYQEYASKTPILFPFIPLYHFVKDE